MSLVATISYCMASVAFLLLSAILFMRPATRQMGQGLSIVCFVTALWAAITAIELAGGKPLSLGVHLLDSLHIIAWVAYLFTLQHAPLATRLGRVPKVGAAGIVACLAVASAVMIVYTTQAAPAWLLWLVASPGARVVLAIAGMMLVEGLFRSIPADQRWAVKFACLGIIGLFVYDFYLYSDAMLFRQVNPEIWAARGFVNALTGPLLAISTARSPRWVPNFAVSRRAMFHSAALLSSGIYLLVMAAAGYYLRYVGGSWGTIMQTVFLFGSVLLLVAVLFSGTFRSWLKVFISKHFFRYNYDYREEWIRFTRTLSAKEPALGDRVIRAIAELVESPGGALFAGGESGTYEVVTCWNMHAASAEEKMTSSFCQFLKARQWVIDVEEWRACPEKYDGLPIPTWLNDIAQAWLIVPLVLQERLVGFTVLAHARSRIRLNWEVLDLLKIAGSQAASYLAQDQSANALMVARQFESFNRMSTFVVHDLKNLVSQLSLMLANAEKHRGNPEFQKDMLETVDHSIQKMKLLLHKLSRGHQADKPELLCLDELLLKAVAEKSTFRPSPAVGRLDTGLIVYGDRERLERIVGHLIQNAIEATGSNGKVAVRLARQEACAVIEVEDNGQGMSEEFVRERLFKPFVSTKSAGMGIGVFEAREYIHELGGRLEVLSSPGIGTTFRLHIPLRSSDHHSMRHAA